MHPSSRYATSKRQARLDDGAIGVEPAVRPDRAERLERRRDLLVAARLLLAQCEQGRLTGLGSDTTTLRDLVAGLERLVAAGDAGTRRTPHRSGHS
jgi:hypothetical protein